MTETDKEKQPFWRTKRLYEMSEAEWESLCDGCGQCCLHKLEDVDSGEIAVTNVACKLLDMKSCRCSSYANRWDFVPDCVQLTPEKASDLGWLPETCAYRLLAEGKDLHDWHPLLSGDADSVHKAGISVRDNAVSEVEIDDLEDHVTGWILDGNNPFDR
ncbi:YcgN family cysteine cluster protein [Aestuariispira insulae]|uniref:UPF0260 protein DFP90_10965 n=1 Tax=Aestuariispira insulae TaxID=1461337 RepID=A0A3D9HEN2_9PROT|nr:YcgN family cysteine cluster protein [Aestuariispira insulae]RED47701.1 hypothetical protein DFP90_10965 [Aestuariispira insulae]